MASKRLLPSYWKPLTPTTQCSSLLYRSSPNLLIASSSSNESIDKYKNLNKIFLKYPTKKHQVNYSKIAEAAATQSFSNESNNGVVLARKKSEVSETRERFNNIRYFYADPEIDKAAERPLIRLNPMTMLYMGVSTDNSHLLQSANYLRNELPIRLAHMIKEFRNLPFIVASNPSMLDIHERCIKTFRMFDNFDVEIKDINTEKRFNQLVYEMLEMNKDLLALLCDGFKDTRRYINNELFIKTNLNRILSARLGIRLLCEHHIALNKQSSLKNVLLGSDSLSDDTTDHSNDNHNHDNFNSSYLSGDNNGNGNGNGSNNSNLVGIIHKKFSPKKLIETSGRMVTRLCIDRYGVSPKIKIDGHINALFPYLPLPVEYILPELLKNSFRATYEHHHKSSPSLPDVNITIVVNEKDFVIRIRDRGGGIPHAVVNKIFDYHFTTAGDESTASNTNNTNTNNKNDTDVFINNFQLDPLGNSVVGAICEASSSRGLAVMHGYGFGLPTSKAYAEYLGGSITFQSMQGIGTDFYLRLGRLDVEPEMVRI